MECRFCGNPVDPRRVELGYDYCTSDECQRRGLEPVKLARVAVNKSADQFVRAEDVLPPPQVLRDRLDHAPHLPPSPMQDKKAPPRRRRSALERLQAAEAELDRQLEESFQRFSRSEIAAAEMAKERDALIRAFNRGVMAENIRYRHMLRQRRPA